MRIRGLSFCIIQYYTYHHALSFRWRGPRFRYLQAAKTVPTVRTVFKTPQPLLLPPVTFYFLSVTNLEPRHFIITMSTPFTSAPSISAPSYTLPTPWNAWNAGYDGRYLLVMGNNTYPHHPYPAVLSSMMLQHMVASPPRPIDPAPTTADGWALPILRPVPIGGVMSQPGMNSLDGQGPLMPWAFMMPDSDPQSHSAQPSTPPAPAAGTTQAKNQINQKNAGGRIPCSRCSKTYKNKKHLKRHFHTRKFDPFPSTGAVI